LERNKRKRENESKRETTLIVSCIDRSRETLKRGMRQTYTIVEEATVQRNGVSPRKSQESKSEEHCKPLIARERRKSS